MGDSPVKQQSVCIIGAGAAGLCALRHFTSRRDRFNPIVCYEQTDKLAGTWNYTDNTGTDEYGLPIHSSMYRDLRTNLPLEIMAFPDFKSHSQVSFVHHSQVLSYLLDYAEHFNLRPFIHFGHHLCNVTRNQANTHWLVTVRNLLSEQTSTRPFDVLLLCPGRYSVPNVPSLSSLPTFTGSVMHSHHYRTREPYQDQRVAIIGAGPSGIDIALEVASVAREVLLLNRKEPYRSLPANVREIHGEIDHFTKHSIVLLLQDGKRQEFPIESVIFATGYKYNLAFLDETTSGLRLNEHQTLPGLYRQLINIEQPTMALLSVLMRILPFPLYHQQILYFMGHILGDIGLPSKEEMYTETEREFAHRRSLGYREQDRHLANIDLQEEYHRCLVREGRLRPLAPVILTLYRHLAKVRSEHIETYKEKNYRLLDENTFVEV